MSNANGTTTLFAALVTPVEKELRASARRQAGCKAPAMTTPAGPRGG